MKKLLLISITFISLYSNTENSASEKLEKYKEHLQKGTYASNCSKSIKSRYHTFSYAFDHFERNNGKILVELGTTRSFVHGGLPGCNLDDPCYWTPNNPERWDWGAGCFTRMAAECLQHLNPTIHTIDIASSHINRCRTITKEFSDMIKYRVASSLRFLQSYQGDKIDLIYVDTGDMTPIEPTARLQLQEVKIIVERDLLSENGLILIDDVRNPTPKLYGETSELGKAKYSIAYLLEHGYEILVDEYQVVLGKIKK